MFMKSVLGRARDAFGFKRLAASCLRITAKMVTELGGVNFTQASE
jgi:hypothetical protein